MTARSARPGPGRPRETYGDVGRVIEKPQLVHGDHEGNNAKAKAVLAAEPRRRYARVQDCDGHQWERGTTRWTCTSPINGRDVTQVGRLGWSSLVQMYGPITVVDENLPPAPAPRCSVERQLINDDAGDPWAGGEWTTCNGCGSRVRFRVRGTDRPPLARILPHRTDGTPTR